jgi:hypothetical protein
VVRPRRDEGPEEHVPSKQEVAKKLQALIDRLDEAGPDVHERLAGSVPSRVIQIELTDLDTAFWSELHEGRMSGLAEGSTPDAEVRVTTDSDTLVDILDGKRSLLSSYVAGHVRIDASMADLLTLRKLL